MWMRVRAFCLRSPWPALLVLTGALAVLAAAAASCNSGSAEDSGPPTVLEVRYAVPGVDDDGDGFDDEHVI